MKKTIIQAITSSNHKQPSQAAITSSNLALLTRPYAKTSTWRSAVTDQSSTCCHEDDCGRIGADAAAVSVTAAAAATDADADDAADAADADTNTGGHDAREIDAWGCTGVGI